MLGTTSDPLHLVKRKAVGSLSFESFAIRHDGTMIYGDELAPSGGNAGGAIYKFVPAVPYQGNGPESTVPRSVAVGVRHGLRPARGGVGIIELGPGRGDGEGTWTLVNLGGAGVVDGNGNIILRTAQVLQRFTGLLPPRRHGHRSDRRSRTGVFRACWANTGRMSHGGGSLVENGGCLRRDHVSRRRARRARPCRRRRPGRFRRVERFIAGSPKSEHVRQRRVPAAHRQSRGARRRRRQRGHAACSRRNHELRGNDLWICLPDGADDDTQSDGCVRFASLRDTSSEPTGFIFLGSGEEAFVSLQHRSVDEANGRGSLLKISGFKIR